MALAATQSCYCCHDPPSTSQHTHHPWLCEVVAAVGNAPQAPLVTGSQATVSAGAALPTVAPTPSRTPGGRPLGGGGGGGWWFGGGNSSRHHRRAAAPRTLQRRLCWQGGDVVVPRHGCGTWQGDFSQTVRAAKPCGGLQRAGDD